MRTVISLAFILMATPAWAVICGDSDLNGVINIRDPLRILRHSVELPSPCKDNAIVCDVDGDGDIDVNDALDVLRRVVGYWLPMDCKFPVVVQVTGATPLAGMSLTLTYPPSQATVMAGCDFNTGGFDLAQAFAPSDTETGVAMITLTDVPLPADIIRCDGYGHYASLVVVVTEAFDADLNEAAVGVDVVPNMAP
jgi:hypothetical protein